MCLSDACQQPLPLVLSLPTLPLPSDSLLMSSSQLCLASIFGLHLSMLPCPYLHLCLSLSGRDPWSRNHILSTVSATEGWGHFLQMLPLQDGASDLIQEGEEVPKFRKMVQ